MFFCFYIYSCTGYASTQKELGDIGRYAIPVSAALISVFNLDSEGIGQLVLSTVAVQTTTEVLKKVAHEKRPNGSSYNSFPSGHVSSAFTGASFVHFRYNFNYSIPLYLGSAYVAYTRVQANAHYPHDVLAGALIGIAGTYLFTTKFNEENISLVADTQYAGILYRKIFD